MKGWVKLHRKLWENPAIKREKFSKQEAWIWLFSHAQYEKAVVVFGGEKILLFRGQLVTSIRFLAGRFMWSPGKVQRFLGEMVKANQISIQPKGGKFTFITISNYDAYQMVDPGENGNNEHTEERYTDGHTERYTDGHSQVVDNPDGYQEERYTNEHTERYTDGHRLKNNKNNKENKSLVLTSPVGDDGIRSSVEFVKLYNQLCPSLDPVKILTPQRRDKYNKRLTKKRSRKFWVELFKKAEASPFLVGGGPRGWRANLDWLIKADNMVKVLEGRYDEKNKVKKPKALTDKELDDIVNK